MLALCAGAAPGQDAPAADPAAKPASAPQTTQENGGQAPASPAAQESHAEMTTTDVGTTFKLRVNLVQVRVVVRDAKGNPVNNLKREDFQLYDQGKLQPITTFAVETRETRLQKAEAARKTQTNEPYQPPTVKEALPDRFIALEFDDIHLTQEDATFVRVAAGKFLDSLAPTDRVGVYTTSGEVTQEFTSDLGLVRQKLLGISPRPKMGRVSVSDCPQVSPYMADLVQNRNDQVAFHAIVLDAWACAYQNDPKMYNAAVAMAQSSIPPVASSLEANRNYAYRTMQDTIRRLAAMPGERVMLLVSPGFIMGLDTSDMILVVDQANHANVVINTLDARGLYTPDMGDITNNRQGIVQLQQYRVSAQTEQSYILQDFAAGTGGTHFHNSNDITGGLKQLGAAPEICYILGFSPQNQKMDGTFHTLKVKLAGNLKYQLQARRGYYAPKKVNDPKEQARQEIQEAIFSRDEILDMPMDLQTQYFKKSEEQAQLSVVTRLNLQGIHFKKTDGRNYDVLTLATAIFDDNGNFVVGGEKVLTMRLLDATYSKLMTKGISVKSSFDVKPGKYMVRQVVRDSEGEEMAARNGAVDIPF